MSLYLISIGIIINFTANFQKRYTFKIEKNICVTHFYLISVYFRSRLDPNREDLEGAQGDPLAIQAYREFHFAINHAKSVVKRGLLVDFHGFNLDWVF